MRAIGSPVGWVAVRVQLWRVISHAHGGGVKFEENPVSFQSRKLNEQIRFIGRLWVNTTTY
jgi:hypothetical protein